jgi:hypothetical protein
MNSVLKHCWLTLALTLSWSVAVSAAEASIVLISSDTSGAYLEATQALRQELSRHKVPDSEVQQLSLAAWTAAPSRATRLYLAMGADACEALARSDLRTTVLCSLLPQGSFERILRDSGRRSSSQFSALYLNQPLARQIDLLRLALPQAHRVGVLLGVPAYPGQHIALAEVIGSRGLTLVSRTVAPQESVFAGLKFILDEADILLALADAQIYNSSSIQNILLASFRAQVPMLAFSPAYVRAGALLAVYSTPAQIGRQAGELAHGVFQGKTLPMSQFPRDFSVMVNDHVARSLSLTLDSQQLQEKLLRLEAGR